MKGINVLFEYGKYIIFHDPTTDYIWIYDNNLHYPIYIFKFINKIKKFLKGGNHGNYS